MMTEPVRYSGSITWRDEPAIHAAVDRAAKARRTKPSEWLRQAIRTALQLDGIDPEPMGPRDAGALYDVVEGKRRYALVARGNPDRVLAKTSRLAAIPDISDVSYHPAGYLPIEGDAWLPLAFEDSEPFDLATHWRLAPVYTIEADRVVCTYPVVVQSSLEHA